MNPKCGTKTKAAFAKHTAGKLPALIGWWADSKLKLPGLTKAATQDVIRAAFVLANQYVPIPFYRVKTSRNALIVLRVMDASDFDGPGNVLAMADVASLYDVEQREIWFDPSEAWATNRARDMAIYALPVCCHEIGHTLGFGHGKQGLMAPYYDPLITTPTAVEVNRFYQEYDELKP